MEWKGLPIVIFGTGGMAKETRCIIREINKQNYVNMFDFIGYIGEDECEINRKVSGDIIISSDKKIEQFISKYNLIGVVIPFGFPKVKEKIYQKLKDYSNVVFPNIISPSANILNIDSFNVGIGNIISAGATLTTNIKMGNFNLINMNASIGHDVVIEDFCVINPQATVSGNVHIKSKVLLGANSSVKQGLIIRENSTIGLGGFVVKDVNENEVLVCNSAKPLR